MKKPIPCNYAVVRFLPYPDAGEFVNVGVVMHSPVTGFFDFRLEVKKTRRVTSFFPEMDSRLVLDALRNCERELKRMRDEIGINADNPDQMILDPNLGAAFFREIIRPRETVIRFSGAGTALISDPVQLLRELFDHYVERMFAQEPEYQEQIMQRRLGETLKVHNLITRFKSAKVGNEDYHVNFPFVHQPRIGLFDRAIKPLNLGQAESTKIYEHGDEWLNRILRLRRINAAPMHILFPVHRPDTGGKREAAFAEICDELRNIGVTVVPEEDDSEILRFARDASDEGQLDSPNF